IVAKNGILIVEFANQLRNAGKSILEAVRESAQTRLRPILMTSISTAIGAVPLTIGHGAGVESRMAIGVVIIGGVVFATFLTLFIVPSFYAMLAGWTRPASFVSDLIKRMERDRRPQQTTPAE
ncbi:MAG: efflux RND transporter permease subunit, partial [Rhodospirillales bacterium]